MPVKGDQTSAGTVHYRKVNCKAEETSGLTKGNMKKSSVYNCLLLSFALFISKTRKREYNVEILFGVRMRWTGHLARIGKRINVCRILVGKPKGRRPLGRPGHRLVDNIKMDLRG
jgi:hypothetical protein